MVKMHDEYQKVTLIKKNFGLIKAEFSLIKGVFNLINVHRSYFWLMFSWLRSLWILVMAYNDLK